MLDSRARSVTEARPAGVASRAERPPSGEELLTDFEPLLVVERSQECISATDTGPVAPPALPTRFAAEAAALKNKLATAFPDAAADEQVLHDLAAEEWGLLRALNEVSATAAVGLLDTSTNVKQRTEHAQLLREIVLAGASLTGRIRAALGTAATLRAHRELARRHRQKAADL